MSKRLKMTDAELCEDAKYIDDLINKFNIYQENKKNGIPNTFKCPNSHKKPNKKMLMTPYSIASRKIKKDRTEYLNSLSDIERDVVDFAWAETLGRRCPVITKFESSGAEWRRWVALSKGNYPNIYWKEKELHSIGRGVMGGWMKIKAMELIINP